MSRNKESDLKKNYHPDAVKFMLEKHGPGINSKQAEEADQEWAANRAQEFAKGHGRINAQSAEAIMQEPPLGASIPMKRSEEFDYAKENTGLKGNLQSENQADVPSVFRNNQKETS